MRSNESLFVYVVSRIRVGLVCLGGQVCYSLSMLCVFNYLGSLTHPSL